MKQLIFLIICLSIVSCLKDEPLKQKNEGFLPTVLNDDWEISTPKDEDINTELLTKAYDLVYSDERYMMARSLLVIRNGKLVAEAYPHDKGDINKLNNIQSCTKSITSILTGIAFQKNLINSLDEELYNIYPEYFDDDIEKRGITIYDALTMQTGLEFDNSKHTLGLYTTNENSASYVLGFDRTYDSGTMVNYNDGAPQLISKLIEKKSGRKLHDFANEYLFEKLNITDWKWESAKDGTTFGAFSLFLKSRDLAKIGQLLVQNGFYDGEQLIDTTYLKEATSVKVSVNYNNEPYGYYFWILPAWNAYNLDGHGGQFVLVAPDKQLVVVYTAWAYTNSIIWDRSNELMKIIINSCE